MTDYSMNYLCAKNGGLFVNYAGEIKFKGTFNVISSDPPFNEGKVWFTTVQGKCMPYRMEYIFLNPESSGT